MRILQMEQEMECKYPLKKYIHNFILFFPFGMVDKNDAKIYIHTGLLSKCYKVQNSYVNPIT